MIYPEETLDERLARLEAEDKARPDYQHRQLLHDIQFGSRKITPQDLENLEKSKPVELSDEQQFALQQNERDGAELEAFYGRREWPELYRSIVAYCNAQSPEWQKQKYAEIEEFGQVKVFKNLISQLRPWR